MKSLKKRSKFDFSFFLLILILTVLMFVNANIVFIDNTYDSKIEVALNERQVVEDENR